MDNCGAACQVSVDCFSHQAAIYQGETERNDAQVLTCSSVSKYYTTANAYYWSVSSSSSFRGSLDIPVANDHVEDEVRPMSVIPITVNSDWLSGAVASCDLSRCLVREALCEFSPGGTTVDLHLHIQHITEEHSLIKDLEQHSPSLTGPSGRPP